MMVFVPFLATSNRNIQMLVRSTLPCNLRKQERTFAPASGNYHVCYSGMSTDRHDLRRLLDHVAAHRVGFCVVATRDRLSEDPEQMADIDEALDDALVAIVVAADHVRPDRDGD